MTRRSMADRQWLIVQASGVMKLGDEIDPSKFHHTNIAFYTLRGTDYCSIVSNDIGRGGFPPAVAERVPIAFKISDAPTDGDVVTYNVANDDEWLTDGDSYKPDMWHDFKDPDSQRYWQWLPSDPDKWEWKAKDESQEMATSSR